jgi:hypothetical protein
MSVNEVALKIIQIELDTSKETSRRSSYLEICQRTQQDIGILISYS